MRKVVKIPSRMNLSRGAMGDSVRELQTFLGRFGYLQTAPDDPFAAGRGRILLPKSKAGTFDDTTLSALRTYQRFHKIPDTGVLDEATIAMMKMPRCGFPDAPFAGSIASFVASGNKWEYENLTYRFENLTPDLTDEQVHNAIAMAFQLWSSVTPLRFTEVASNQDILIRFVAGEHGDGAPFDGVGNVLAHAFFPQIGDAHFDEAEIWTLDSSTGPDLLTIAAHEFGHSLGLNHTNVTGALMLPTFTGIHHFLSQDDIDGVQSIYGYGRDDLWHTIRFPTFWQRWGDVHYSVPGNPGSIQEHIFHQYRKRPSCGWSDSRRKHVAYHTLSNFLAAVG